MQIPVWTKPALWGAVAGAIAIAYLGFSQFGWTTAGSAEQLAQERADTVVVAALVPFCVANAQQDPDKAALARLRAEESSYTRAGMVTKAGWATLVGDAAPAGVLATAFSEKLHSMKSS
jgi:hypothetical protein